MIIIIIILLVNTLLQGSYMHCLLWDWTAVLLFNSDYTVLIIEKFLMQIFIHVVYCVSVHTCNIMPKFFEFVSS